MNGKAKRRSPHRASAVPPCAVYGEGQPFIDVKMEQQILEAAAKEGVTVLSWIRTAIQARLGGEDES